MTTTKEQLAALADRVPTAPATQAECQRAIEAFKRAVANEGHLYVLRTAADVLAGTALLDAASGGACYEDALAECAAALHQRAIRIGRDQHGLAAPHIEAAALAVYTYLDTASTIDGERVARLILEAITAN